MRVGLIINKITSDRRVNLEKMLAMAEEAAAVGADLILFSEAALTGLANNDDPEHDLKLGETIPGPGTEIIAEFVRRHDIWMGLGMLEREKDCLYDTAVLFNPQGEICLKYRRVSPQWHGRNADPNVYRQGTSMEKTQTPWGTAAFLLCGDLFDDEILAQVKMLRPDWLLLPFSRSFHDGTADQDRWEKEELGDYFERVRMVGIPTLMVNYLGYELPEDDSFGGACYISANGQLVAVYPLGKEGYLMVEANRIP